MKKRIKFVVCLSFITLVLSSSWAQDPKSFTDPMITEYWHSGKTLPVEISRQYSWPVYLPKKDNGINVMIDLAHQCSFASMWDMPDRLYEMGFRGVGNMSSLSSVLKKGGQSRIRAFYDQPNRIFPFAWIDNPEFNVIISEQTDPTAQSYTQDEITALEEFVASGGGLVILASPLRDSIKMRDWSINQLAATFGAKFSTSSDTHGGIKYSIIEGSKNLNPLHKGENGKTIIGGLKYKKGYVAFVGNAGAFHYNDKDSEEKISQVQSLIKETVLWASKGKKPIKGKPNFSMTMGGGGAIYPELEHQEGSIVLYYAANQKEELLKCVQVDVPIAMKQVEKWLPSKPTDEPMYLVLAAGDGGGWAVNAFRPKENGIISLSTFGLLSIFGHELAHTMAGPLNSNGEKAGLSPIPNQGEAHAGWYQGKVNALFDHSLECKSNRECNRIFEKDGVVKKLDLAKHYENEEGRKIWGYGTAWNKVWYIWQKLDDRYGPTWYPRWRWIQHTRWIDEPQRELSWEEMIEDMSIAVGEDLFPFFIKLGTTLNKSRLESVLFQGKTIQLKPAPLEPTLAGHVRLEDIGDYTKPLVY